MIFISFILSLNFSLLSAESQVYLDYLGRPNNGYVFGPLLPIFAVPIFIALHFIAKKNLRTCLLFTMLLVIIGNLLYFLAYDWSLFSLFMIGRALTGTGAPGLALKQFIGYHVSPQDRARVAVMYTTASFVGSSCGYFLGFAFEGSVAEFLGYKLNGIYMGGFLLGFVWVLTFLLCSTLFVNPNINYPAETSNKTLIKFLLGSSYLLPSLLREAFISPVAIPNSLDWPNQTIYAYLGVFSLMIAPTSILIYASTYFTKEKVLLIFSKIWSLLGCTLIVIGRDTAFWYIIGAILLLVGVNVGSGVSFSLLSKNIRNDSIGMTASIIEVFGLVLGYVLAKYLGWIAQILLVFVVAISLIGDFWQYKHLDHAKHKKAEKAKKI